MRANLSIPSPESLLWKSKEYNKYSKNVSFSRKQFMQSTDMNELWSGPEVVTFNSSCIAAYISFILCTSFSDPSSLKN